MKKDERELERLDSLPYEITLLADAAGGYVASHPDLPGCVAQGDTADEAVADLHAARRLWLESNLRRGLPVPEPPSREHSGKVLLRMPASLHESLARLARRQGVSLNLLLNTALAEFVGRSSARRGTPAAEVERDSSVV